MLNLTPHAITIFAKDGKTVVKTVEPSGTVARAEALYLVQEFLDGIPVETVRYGEVQNVPEPGTEKFLVSAMVLERLPESYNGWAFAPNTGAGAVRSEDGKILGTKSLITVTKK